MLHTAANELPQPSIEEAPVVADDLEDLLLREDSCYAHLGASPSSSSIRSGSSGKHSNSSRGTVRQLESNSEDEGAAASLQQLTVQQQAAVLAEALHSMSSSCGSGESSSCGSISLSTDSAGFTRPPRRRSVRRHRRAFPRAASQQVQQGTGFNALPPVTMPPLPTPPPAPLPLRRQDAESARAPEVAPQLQTRTAPAGPIPVPMHFFVEQRPDLGHDIPPTAAAAAPASQQWEETRRSLFDLVAWPQGDPLAANPRYHCIRKLSRWSARLQLFV